MISPTAKTPTLSTNSHNPSADYRFYRYADYLKAKYQERVQKITIDAGFTCPNRDGTKAIGGCTYCNNDTFAPTHLQKKGVTGVREQLEHGIAIARRRYKNVRKYIAYFQSYSNTYAELDHLQALYEEALAHPEVIGLAIGTRPDCIDEKKLAYLEALVKERGKDITIEYGLESIADSTLEKINRGHTYAEFESAVLMTANRGITICTHIILGFPWEDQAHWFKSAEVLSALPIDFLKIHQLHVVKHTKMGNDYLKAPFKTLSLDEYTEILVGLVERLRPTMVIQRLFGEAPPELLLSEHWQVPESQFLKHFNEILIQRQSYQGKLYQKNL